MLARPERKDINLEIILRTRTQDISTLIHSQTHELRALRRSHSPEVPVLNKIKSPDCAIQRATDYSVTLAGHENNVGYFLGVLSESTEAEVVLLSPKLYFSVICSCCNVATVWRVGEAVEVKLMALLLKNVALAFPLPYHELTLLFRGKSNPFSGGIDRSRVNSAF